jgi:DNA-binding HxlR family transcriptional regulator
MDKNKPELGPLIELVHHRWNIPVIAELYRRSGAKYVTLVNSLDVSRASLSTSLNDLIDQGLVRRNTGHGHPMRPEYLLTEDGLVIGEHCLSLARLVRQRKEANLAFRKWTLPLVAAIGGEVRRFHEVRGVLLGATPRAVTIGLKSLLAQRWATRILIDDYPPATGYELKPKGQRILTCVSGLY